MNIIVFLLPFVLLGAIIANPIDVSSSQSVSIASSSGPGQTFMQTSVVKDGNYVVTRTNNGNTQVFEGSVSGPSVNRVETRNDAPGIIAANNQVSPTFVGPQTTSTQVSSVVQDGKIITMRTVNGDTEVFERPVNHQVDLHRQVADQVDTHLSSPQPCPYASQSIPAREFPAPTPQDIPAAAVQIIPTPSIEAFPTPATSPYPPAHNVQQVHSSGVMQQSSSTFQSSTAQNGQTVAASSSCATDANGVLQCAENRQILTSRQNESPVEPNRIGAPVNSPVLREQAITYPDAMPQNTATFQSSNVQTGQSVAASSSCATNANGVLQCAENQQILTSGPNRDAFAPNRMVPPVSQVARNEAPIEPAAVQQSSTTIQSSAGQNGQTVAASSSCATDANGILQCSENRQVLTSGQGEGAVAINRMVAPVSNQVVRNETPRTPAVASISTSTSCSTGSDGIPNCTTTERKIVVRSIPEKKNTDKTDDALTSTSTVQVSNPVKD